MELVEHTGQWVAELKIAVWTTVGASMKEHTVEFSSLTITGSMTLQSHITGWMNITVQLTSLLVTENTCL